MKKILLISTALFSLNAMSQQLDATNEPSIGQNQVMYVCDTLTSNYDATVGTGITWDYSGIVGLDNQTQTVDVLDATTAPNASDFPTSVKAFSIENSYTNYFNSTATERVSQGFVYEEPSFGTVLAQYNTNEQKLMTYPFAYGSSLTDAFSGELTFEFNGIPQNPSCTGNSYAWIDGQGTLLLPSSTSFSNVIRYKIIDTSFVNVFGLDVEFIRTQYEYYSTTTNDLPLFTHSSFKIQQSGASTPLLSQNVVLSSVQPETSLGITENKENNLTVYPNPTNGILNIKGLNESSEIKVFDQSGRLVQELKNVFNSIDLTDLENGFYNLQISSNGTVSTQKITIKK